MPTPTSPGGQYLQGKQRVDRMTGPTGDGPLRRRWSWPCPDCADHLEVTDEKLLPALRRLAEHGAPDVSIAGLRARL